MRRRLVSEHFKRDGRAKVGYPSSRAAWEVGNKRHQIVYKCSFCNQYHCAKPRKSS